MDRGSFDRVGCEKFAKENNQSIDALQNHPHEVWITRDQLIRIASGEKNVEVVVNYRDENKKGIPAHIFFVTAPPSALAAVKEFAGTRVAVCKGPVK
jgi:hypothetical protein